MPHRDTREFLGKGWRFPLGVDPNGRIATATFEQRIEESIYVILSTAKGERLMRPDFGCGIHELVFAPNNAITRSNVVHAVRAALTSQEPRIDLLGVDVDTSDGQPNLLLIRLTYRVRVNNAIGNMVYPFFIHEAA